jgi:hypothetical protein
LQQAFDLITALRRIARQQLAQAGANTAYQQALFWHTLNVMRLKTIEPERKRQALASAALILERHFKPPPPNLPLVRGGTVPPLTRGRLGGG